MVSHRPRATLISIVKQAGKKRVVSRLGRQGAVRKNKEIAAELRGHKFVARQFYQVMTCAFCDKFLVNNTGYQCQGTSASDTG